MFKLFRCEWLRIYKTILMATLIHFVLLGLLVNFGLFSSDAIGFKMSLVLFYCGCGYLFGITQIKKYTQGNHWTYFINRPISAKKVFVALFLAAITGILVVIVLPFFTITFILDRLNVGIIDWRHYSQLAYIMGMTLSFYLLACCISLSQRKSTYLLVLLALLPVISINLGGSVYWLLLAVIIWLLLLVLSLVKANLNGRPDGFINQSFTVIAFQYCVYFILTSLFFMSNIIILDIGNKTQENSSNKSSEQTFKSTSYTEISNLNAEDRLITSLQTENNPNQDLIEEIQLNQTKRIRKRIWFHSTKQQLPFMDENKAVIKDSDNQVIWQFSHDLMLFVGKNTNNNKIIGYLGPNELFLNPQEANKAQDFESVLESVFESVPWVNNDQIVTKNKVYQYQNINQSFRLLYSVDEDEVLLNDLQDQGSVKSIITTKNVYIFDSIDYDNNKIPLQTKLKMPLPGDYNNLWDIQISEVNDGFIVSFLYGKSSRQNVYEAKQLTYEFNLSGQVKLINQRKLKQSPSMLIKDLDYFISPAWKLFLDYFPIHPSRDRYLDTRPQVYSLSPSTLITIIVLALLYAFITLLLSKNRDITRSSKWLWAVLNSVLGLPGLYSFLLLNPKHIQIVDLTKNSEVAHV